MAPHHSFLLEGGGLGSGQVGKTDFDPLLGAPPLSSDDHQALSQLSHFYTWLRQRPFASAPVRSKPRRTYDPSRPTPDPEGDYVPMYLADLSSRGRRMWTVLKERLEDFGKTAGLFDEISIRQLGAEGAASPSKCKSGSLGAS